MKTKITSFIALILSIATMGQQVPRASKMFVKSGLQFHTWAFTGGEESPFGEFGVNPNSITSTPSGANSVRYLRLQLPGYNGEILSLAELQVYSGGVNVALNKTSTQSSTLTGSAATANKANDGNTDGDYSHGSVTHTNSSSQPWWQVDLGSNFSIDSVRVWNRTDCCRPRLRGYYIIASPNPFVSTSLKETIAETGVILIGPKFAIGSEYTNLPLTQDFYEKPGYNFAFFNRHPNAKWGMEKAPFGDHLLGRPSADEIANGFLNLDQKTVQNNLITLGLGDEENYSAEVLDWTTQWFNLFRRHYPNTLLHTNQYSNQWNDAQILAYMASAKPDFLSYDYYFYSEPQTEFAGGSLQPIYDDLGRYRRLALQGLDGTGAQPIEFGQYTIGFKTGAQQFNGGLYYASESQIYGEVFGSLTMGAKWLSAWRYVKGDNGYWIDNSGRPLAGYYWYAKAVREFNNLSPHLSRLHTTDVRIIPGQHLSGGAAVTNAKPAEVALWSSASGDYITNIAATNLVPGTNNGLKGDVMIGYFRPLTNLSTDSDLTLAPVPNQNTHYFMIMNGLTKANGCCHRVGTTGFANDTLVGKSNLAMQKIHLDIDFGNSSVDVLKRISRSTGLVETVGLTFVSAKKYSVDITLDGGKGDLFYWENAHTKNRKNLSLNKPATQSSDSSNNFLANKAVDGDTSGVIYPANQGSHTNQESQPWWQVDLGKLANINEIRLYNRTDCCRDRLTNYHIFVSDVPFTSNTVAGTKAQSGVRDFANAGQAGSPSTLSLDVTGRYVRVQLESTNGILNMGEVEVYGEYVVTNLALRKTATQSSEFTPSPANASRAVDGNTNGNFSSGSVTHTSASSQQPWLQVDLGAVADITDIRLYNRTDCCSDRLTNYHVFVSDTPFTSNTVAGTQAQPGVSDFTNTGQADSPSVITVGGRGRYVRVQLEGSSAILSIADLEVYGNLITISNLALNQPATQSSTNGTILVAGKSVDGDTSGVIYPANQGSHTNQESQPWWQVDLGGIANLTDIKLFNRTDCCADRLTNYHVFVSDVPFSSNTVAGTKAQSGVRDFANTGQAGNPSVVTVGGTGRYVRVQLESTNGILNMGEVEVFGSYGNINSNNTSITARGINSTSNKILVTNALSSNVDINVITERLKIYPNPVTNNSTLNVSFNTSIDKDVLSISLINSSGQVIWTRKENISFGNNQIKIEMENLSQGIYFLNLTSSDYKTTEKVVVGN